MNITVLNIGTEVLIGHTLNSNLRLLANMLLEKNLFISKQITIGDELETIVENIKTELESSELLILTGGLGPTEDDLTTEAVGRALDLELELDKDQFEKIKTHFAKQGRNLPSNNIKQAYFPIGAKILENEMGTAPGFYVSSGGVDVVVLPGPPKELENTFSKYVSKLDEDDPLEIYCFNCFGVGESLIEQYIRQMEIDSEKIFINTYVRSGVVSIKMFSLDGDEVYLNEVKQTVRNKLTKSIFTEEDESLEQVLIHTLQNRNLSIGTAESMTGGMIAGKLTTVAGASEVFKGGVVTYTNEMKMKMIDVSEETLEEYTAVSEPVAREMARGVQVLTGADVVASITGLAGPGGGTDEIPVGKVFVCIRLGESEYIRELQLTGVREQIRERAANTVLFELIKKIEKMEEEHD